MPKHAVWSAHAVRGPGLGQPWRLAVKVEPASASGAGGLTCERWPAQAGVGHDSSWLRGTAANVPDVTLLQAMVNDFPPIRTPSGRRRGRPGAVHEDKGYDSRANRA